MPEPTGEQVDPTIQREDESNRALTERVFDAYLQCNVRFPQDLLRGRTLGFSVLQGFANHIKALGVFDAKNFQKMEVNPLSEEQRLQLTKVMLASHEKYDVQMKPKYEDASRLTARLDGLWEAACELPKAMFPILFTSVSDALHKAGVLNISGVLNIKEDEQKLCWPYVSKIIDMTMDILNSEVSTGVAREYREALQRKDDLMAYPRTLRMRHREYMLSEFKKRVEERYSSIDFSNVLDDVLGYLEE